MKCGKPSFDEEVNVRHVCALVVGGQYTRQRLQNIFLGHLWSISHLQVWRAKGGCEGDKSRDGGKADEDVLLVRQTDPLAPQGRRSGRLGHDQLPANVVVVADIVVVYVHLPMLCSLLFCLFDCAPAHVVLAATTRLDEEELGLSN